MNSTLKTEILGKAKTTLRITTDKFDTEIGDIIEAGWDTMQTRGITLHTNEIRPMELRCLLTYVRWMFGEPDNPERLKTAFEGQMAMLMMTTNYTDFDEGDIDG